jgi:hypothetical protein
MHSKAFIAFVALLATVAGTALASPVPDAEALEAVAKRVSADASLGKRCTQVGGRWINCP